MSDRYCVEDGKVTYHSADGSVETTHYFFYNDKTVETLSAPRLIDKQAIKPAL